MNTDERERRLLVLIEDYQAAECRTLLEDARSEATALVSEAWRRARAQLHERLVSERANARSRLQAARAEHETRLRASGDRANARLLELAWPCLRQALVARWAVPRSRRIWVDHAVARARQRLPVGLWTLRHPPDWAASEWAPLEAQLTNALDRAPHFRADGALTAGLVIEADGAVLDASLDGLLRDRRRIEARLLALLARHSTHARVGS
jgi:vacuolar-type H+-ATPase subunit H